MRVDSIRIHNYRSILDSQDLAFSPGFNLIVGANNVGKSSLLHCLAARFGGEPHRSIDVLPTRDQPLDRTSRVDFRVSASGAEILRLLLNHCNGVNYLPWPQGIPFDGSRASEVLQRFLSAERISFYVSATSSAGSATPNGWVMPEYPATRLFPWNGENRTLTFNVDAQKATISSPGISMGVSPTPDVGLQLGAIIAQRTYHFHPERMALGEGQYGPTRDLAADARNLPEVLAGLQANPESFAQYSAYVRQVFPSIQKISVRPHPQGASKTEIVVWQIDPRSERDDLAVPLLKCGTGVGQVLAILYVVKTSEQARTIVIDEPGSFLHPGAARALVGILKDVPQHQYIIATHSPEIISELSEVPVTIVRWGNAKSNFDQEPKTTGHLAGSVLSEIGVRLSDVFGFDAVLWVEGQSDAQALKNLLELAGRPQRRVAILPIRDTGSFRRRKIAEVMAIYRALAMGDALLPPALAFLFDRDGRSEQEIEDAQRESGGKVRFLPYRMIENYFLRPEIMMRLLNELGAEHEISASETAVREWLAANGADYVRGPNPPPLYTDHWAARVDGAALLERFVEDFSEGRLDYRKTRDTPRLAVLLYSLDPTACKCLLDLVSDVLQ